jgi:predicted nucleic acid-binding protein
MIFADLVLGDSIFLDANTLIYHFTTNPRFGPACSDLLRRIERQEIMGFTSTHILTEVAHRIMAIEASNTFGWQLAGIVKKLQRHPNQVQQLTGFRRAVEDVMHSSVQVLTIPSNLTGTAALVSQRTGLLSNDALLVAVMQANGLSKLASNDTDFDRVPGLLRYAPLGWHVPRSETVTDPFIDVTHRRTTFGIIPRAR